MTTPSSDPYAKAGLYDGGSVQINFNVVQQTQNGFIRNPAAVYDNATIDIEPEELSTKFWSCSHLAFKGLVTLSVCNCDRDVTNSWLHSISLV